MFAFESVHNQSIILRYQGIVDKEYEVVDQIYLCINNLANVIDK